MLLKRWYSACPSWDAGRLISSQVQASLFWVDRCVKPGWRGVKQQGNQPMHTLTFSGSNTLHLVSTKFVYFAFSTSNLCTEFSANCHVSTVIYEFYFYNAHPSAQSFKIFTLNPYCWSLKQYCKVLKWSGPISHDFWLFWLIGVVFGISILSKQFGLNMLAFYVMA